MFLLLLIGLVVAYIVYKKFPNTEEPVPTVLTVKNIFLNSFSIANNNIKIILGASIFWALTIWIPYINVGTTIGMWALVVGLSKKDTTFSATSIFNPKYRKHMGEFFLLLGFITLGMSMGYMFFIIPGLVISFAWSQAIYLLIDKNLTPLQAIKESNNITYGEKMTIFLGYISIMLVCGIVIGLTNTLLMALIYSSGASALVFLVGAVNICLSIITFSIMVASSIYIYGELSDKSND